MSTRVRAFLSYINIDSSIFSAALWQSVGELARPFFTSRDLSEITVPYVGLKFKIQERFKAWGLAILLFLFLIAVSKMNAMINGAHGAFQNTLPNAAKDPALVSAAWHNLTILASIFVVAAPIVVIYAWLRSLLAIVWRKWLTEYILKLYFAARNFYRIAATSLVDNPDERIANDVDGFVSGALALVLAVADAVITLFFFIQILWGLSFSLTAIVIIYAASGTIISIWLSVKLISFKYNQQKLEADYRYGLINIRNNVEPIAFYQGEKAEFIQLLKRFHAALKNNLSLIGYQRQVSLFTTWFDYFVAILPAAIMLPLYLQGKVQIGAFAQASMAFTQVLGALAIFVSQIGTISTFAANVNRLTGLLAALKGKDPSETGEHTSIATIVGETIAVENVTLMTPDYKRLLIRNVSATVPQGTGLLIKGSSGCGKSSLLRTIAGLWRSGTGTVHRPDLSSLMFLSQKPYMSLGTLREQLLYPSLDRAVPDATLIAALEQANVGFLASRYPGGLDGYPGAGESGMFRPWSDELSPGEQQRLAFARLLIARPRFVFLDEATSALDLANEELLYRTLQSIGATYVSVGHRPSLDSFHAQALNLTGDGGWELVPLHV
ncbi:MAG: ABC transporter ATP-binding protein/permease [Cyanobacteria bacterium SZAS LIN-3]|nr:ABC transporter ATP-binding protein/permease [Cyanobacteria bacterium SZAS LIN-3]